MSGGAWVAQLGVQLLTLTLVLLVRVIEPHIWLLTDSMVPAWDSLSFSAPPFCSCSLFLFLCVSQNKNFKREKKKRMPDTGPCYVM